MTDTPTPYPTDAMVEAAAQAMWERANSDLGWEPAKAKATTDIVFGHIVQWTLDDACAALIAAERAAWSSDMEAAPHETELLLWTPATEHTEAKFEAGWASGGKRVGGYSSVWRHGSAKAWRHLPHTPGGQR